jgi:integrase
LSPALSLNPARESGLWANILGISFVLILKPMDLRPFGTTPKYRPNGINVAFPKNNNTVQVSFVKGLVDLGEGHGNKRRAIVPMNDDLRRALAAAKEMSCTDFVVEYAGRQVGTIKNGFESACARAKIEGVTPHILRHTCATWLVKAKISYEEIGKMLGDTAETIERIYGHHDPEYLNEASEALRLSA